MAPSTPARSSSSYPAAAPRMTDGLGERLRLAGRPGEDGGLDDVGRGRPPGPRIDEVVASYRRGRTQRWTLVPDVARPNRPSACATVAARRQVQDREVVPVEAGIRDAERPGRARAEADRDVAVGIDDGGPVATEQVEGSVGKPALADAVEIEPKPDRAADDGAASPAIERPRPRRSRRLRRRRAVGRGLVRRMLGREPGVEEADVDDARRSGPRRGGPSRGPPPVSVPTGTGLRGSSLSRLSSDVAVKRVRRSAHARHPTEDGLGVGRGTHIGPGRGIATGRTASGSRWTPTRPPISGTLRGHQAGGLGVDRRGCRSIPLEEPGSSSLAGLLGRDDDDPRLGRRRLLHDRLAAAPSGRLPAGRSA